MFLFGFTIQSKIDMPNNEMKYFEKLPATNFQIRKYQNQGMNIHHEKQLFVIL